MIPVASKSVQSKTTHTLLTLSPHSLSHSPLTHSHSLPSLTLTLSPLLPLSPYSPSPLTHSLPSLSLFSHSLLLSPLTHSHSLPSLTLSLTHSYSPLTHSHSLPSLTLTLSPFTHSYRLPSLTLTLSPHSLSLSDSLVSRSFMNMVVGMTSLCVLKPLHSTLTTTVPGSMFTT